MIEIKELKKEYGDRTVIDIDYLKINDGELAVITGPNGSGKSTLLKLIAKTVKKTQGEIALSGDVLYLPQQSIALSKTVLGNIMYCAKGSKADSRKRAEELIAQMGLEALKDKKATGLSGGELQKTALCRLLINKCDLLLLDEPTASADIESTEIIENAILDYKKKTGCTVIMATHSPAQAKKMADRVIMLCDGKVAEDGSPEALLKNPSGEWGRKFISQWTI